MFYSFSPVACPSSLTMAEYTYV